MFGKRSDQVVIVSKQEWEDMQADVRGLKRLAGLEAEAVEQRAKLRTEQHYRFAAAIDALEARVNELQSLVAAFAGASGRNATEFSNRLDRLGATIDELGGSLAGCFRRIEAVRGEFTDRIGRADVAIELARSAHYDDGESLPLVRAPDDDGEALPMTVDAVTLTVSGTPEAEAEATKTLARMEALVSAPEDFDLSAGAAIDERLGAPDPELALEPAPETHSAERV